MEIHCTGTLNHLSIPTRDPAATTAFFKKYFGCEIVTAGVSVLLKRDGFDIVLDAITEKCCWPANFHFGF